MDALFRAVIESTEESVYNSLLRADTLVGRDGHVSAALPAEAVLQLLRTFGRL
jgi:D-aminopeptidase